MGIVFVLLPLSLLLACAGVLAFRWAVQGGQLDDLDAASMRLLFDPESPLKAPPAAREAGEAETEEPLHVR